MRLCLHRKIPGLDEEVNHSDFETGCTFSCCINITAHVLGSCSNFRNHQHFCFASYPSLCYVFELKFTSFKRGVDELVLSCFLLACSHILITMPLHDKFRLVKQNHHLFNDMFINVFVLWRKQNSVC